MNNELQSVIKLQELDRQIYALQEWISSLPHHLREIERQLSDITAAQQAAKDKMGANQRQRKQFEGEIQAIEQKISKYNNQLLEVKSNEEYRAFLKEIEYGKNGIKQIEDKILELMIAAEGDERHLKETEAEMKRQQQQVAREKVEAEAASVGKQKDLEALLEERRDVDRLLSETVRDLYDRIVKLRGSIVVAEARNQICMVCHVMLRPQTFNEIMRNTDIIQCSNCGRIMYWKSSAAAPPPEASQGEPLRE